MDDDSARLSTLLAERVQLARAQALSAGGHLPENELVALEQLQRLQALAQAAQAPAPRRRAAMLALVLLCLVVVSLLLFMHVGSTRIELQATSSALAFVSPEPQPFLALLRPTAVGIAGAASIELPTGPIAAQAMRLAADDSPDRAAKGTGITLQPLALPAGARVQISYDGRPGTLRLSVQSPGLVLQVAALGPVRVQPAGAAEFGWRADTPQPVSVHAGDAPLQLVLEGLPPQTPLFDLPLAVEQLALQRIEQHVEPATSWLRQVSTLRGGTLVFESLLGREVKLRRGQMLALQGGGGTLRTLDWRAEQIELLFAGEVHELNLGQGDDRRSLMPSWLDWLQARHGLAVLWGGALSAFGVLLTVLRWWGLRL